MHPHFRAVLSRAMQIYNIGASDDTSCSFRYVMRFFKLEIATWRRRGRRAPLHHETFREISHVIESFQIFFFPKNKIFATLRNLFREISRSASFWEHLECRKCEFISNRYCRKERRQTRAVTYSLLLSEICINFLKRKKNVRFDATAEENKTFNIKFLQNHT